MSPPATSAGRGLGFAAAVCLVAGNMIGSGIFVMPASLAGTAGPLSLLAWPLCALAFLALTCVFADLGGAWPISGGPSAFTALAFGKPAAFVVAFLYWVCVVIGNAAFVTAFVGYLAVLVPALKAPLPAFLAAQATLWTFTGVNALGVRAAGAVQIVTTVLKVLPLLVLVVALAPHVDAAHLEPFAPHGASALLPSISLVAWLFVGSESITCAGGDVDGGGRSIRRAAYAGFALATLVYLAVAVAVTLALPSSSLVDDPAPLARAAGVALGPAGAVALTLAALVSVGGVLNGWLLVAARSLLPAVDAGLAPRALARPLPALLVSSALTALLTSLYFVDALLAAYNFIALFATATALAAIGAACCACLVLTDRAPERFGAAPLWRVRATAAAGALVIGLMIAGAGSVVVGLTALLALVAAGYAAVRTRAR